MRLGEFAIVIGIVVGIVTILGMIWRMATKAEQLLTEIRDNTQDIAAIKNNQISMEKRLIAKTESEASSMRKSLEDKLSEVNQSIKDI